MEIVLLPILLTSNRYLQTRHRLPTRKTYSESTIKARTGRNPPKTRKKKSKQLEPREHIGIRGDIQSFRK